MRIFPEASVVVEGALVDERECADGGELDTWVAAVGREAAAPTEIYVVWHTHHGGDDDGECVCAQYATSHRPYAHFDVRGNRSS